ncbi:DUF1758 domain-containing protein [Trichonephila clavipes]|uniref:DUF1758 domain-containing protein n=1 Tax=Trichonephila clavipes TaxID=2585209 RepID=A0A8X6VLB5_TRICX|nr:DUF1758 domain-containing protein [Trichonephila clavipes]
MGDRTSKSVELWCPSQCSDIGLEQLRVKNKGVLSTTLSGFLRSVKRGIIKRYIIQNEPKTRKSEGKRILWVFSGCVCEDNLELSITKFWEIENVEIDSVKTSELDICEDHFKSTHSRDDRGRYTVMMPLIEGPSCLGESKQTAIQRLNSLWKRLSKDKEYLSLYEKFLQEYEDLGHMREIKADGSGVAFYMSQPWCLLP